MRVTELKANHVWKASPGCRILVLDGGAVRLDIPRDWVVMPRERHVLLYDQVPPGERCSLGISWHRIPPAALEIPISGLVKQGMTTETRRILQRGRIERHFRPPLEIAWAQLRVDDKAEKREAYTRMAVARAGCTQVVLILEFLPENELSIFSFWQTLLSTLAVGEYIEDPETGRRYEKRG